MTAERDDNSCLWDMLAAARAVESFVRGRTDADYLADLMLRSAVERQIEIIGEAARHVSAAFRTASSRNSLAADPGTAARPRARLWRNQARANLASGHGAYPGVDSPTGAAGASATQRHTLIAGAVQI